MRYPFPGMDPWLEDVRIWRGIHSRLINGLGDELANRLAPRYFVDVDTHTYISRFPEAPILSRYPDISITETRGGLRTQAVAVPAIPGYMELDLPLRETLEEAYIEIRLVPGGEVVTVIELLSHTNKQAGSDRESYLEKRNAYLEADLNFIEIDLLRSYIPMIEVEPVIQKGYRIFVRRKARLFKGYLSQFGVRQAIPLIPIPLQPGEEEPLIDLGAILRTLYERVHYDLVIDYSKPPVPALDKVDASWVQELLSRAGD